jgi:hypothetical protein
MLPVTELPPQANQQFSGLCPVLEPHSHRLSLGYFALTRANGRHTRHVG